MEAGVLSMIEANIYNDSIVITITCGNGMNTTDLTIRIKDGTTNHNNHQLFSFRCSASFILSFSRWSLNAHRASSKTSFMLPPCCKTSGATQSDACTVLGGWDCWVALIFSEDSQLLMYLEPD